ncbi:MAG: hypothetical protein LBP59_05865, partial [Planctomycetaceae bacterium]|nr:hypothetical protein [Planctomycetaceae bacterium]
KGIHIIREADFFTTIIVIPDLSEKSYKWFTSLKTDLPKEKLKKIIDISIQNPKDTKLQNLIDILLAINVDKVKELLNEIGENKMNAEKAVKILLHAIEESPYGAYEIEKIKTEGKAEGIAEGIAKGKGEGMAEGIAKGIAKGKCEDIIQLLTKRIESPPTKLQKEIMKINDNNKLSKLFDFALTCGSIGEFVTAFNEFYNSSQPQKL